MQMKFPYELSEQRISLLSKEDQKIYRFEHSDFFDYNTKQRCMQEYQNALLERQGYYVQEIKKDPKFNALNESEVYETANELTLYEVSQIVDQLGDFIEEAILAGVYTEDEAIKYVNEFVENFKDMSAHSLNEEYGNTVGPDMTYWAKGIGGIFGGFFGIVLALIMRGKTKMAIRMLENSMNKIVEKVDDGVNKGKGRGLIAKIKTLFAAKRGRDGSDPNEGEQNTICLRTLQENFQSDIITKAMVFCKKMGLLEPNWEQAVDDMKDNNTTRGSFSDFQVNIARPINSLCNMKNYN